MTGKEDAPPSYNEANYGGQLGLSPPQYEAFPAQGSASPSEGSGYPPQGSVYPPQGSAYPHAGMYMKSQPYNYYPGQPQFTQQYTQQSAVIVQQPGSPGHVVIQSRPPDYMAAAIFACLCCSWPTGLCAIHYASQVNQLVAEGDMEGARRMSNNARNLVILSIVIGFIWITFAIVYNIFNKTYYRY